MSTQTRPGRRLSGRMRKWWLVTHIVTAAAWFGIDVAFGISVVTAVVTDDPVTAGIAVRSLEIFAIWPMFGAAVLCLVSGIALGLGTKYGVVRYWWVAVKLVLNVLMCALILMSLRTGVDDAGSLSDRLLAGDASAPVPTGLLPPVVVAPAMLLTAYLLSVFKPWGRIRRGARPARRRDSQREPKPLVSA